MLWIQEFIKRFNRKQKIIAKSSLTLTRDGMAGEGGGEGWLVGCFGFNGRLRQYFSLYRAVSQGGEKEERKDRGE